MYHVVSYLIFHFLCKICVPSISMACPCCIHVVYGHHRLASDTVRIKWFGLPCMGWTLIPPPFYLKVGYIFAEHFLWKIQMDYKGEWFPTYSLTTFFHHFHLMRWKHFQHILWNVDSDPRVKNLFSSLTCGRYTFTVEKCFLTKE